MVSLIHRVTDQGHIAESINLVMEPGERQISIGCRRRGVAEILPCGSPVTGPSQPVIFGVEMLGHPFKEVSWSKDVKAFVVKSWMPQLATDLL